MRVSLSPSMSRLLSPTLGSIIKLAFTHPLLSAQQQPMPQSHRGAYARSNDMVCYIAVAAGPQADGNVSKPGDRPGRKQYADGTALPSQAEC